MTPELATEPNTGQRPAATRLTRPWPFFACLLTAYAAYGLALPRVHVPLHSLSPLTALAIIVLPTALFMLLLLGLVLSIVRLRPRPLIALLVGVVFVVASLLVLQLYRPHGHVHISAPWVAVQPVFLDLSKIAILVCFGILLSRIVRTANVLLPVALIVMPIDYLGAMTPVGFTATVIKHHPEIVQHVSVSVPNFGNLHIHNIIGPGDICFLAFFFAVALRLQLNARATFWWMYGLLLATMLMVMTFQVNIAALIPMGFAAVIANLRFFRFQRSEVFAMLYAGILVIGLVVGFYYYSHRLMSH